MDIEEDLEPKMMKRPPTHMQSGTSVEKLSTVKMKQSQLWKRQNILQFILMFLATCGTTVFGCPAECSCSNSDKGSVAKCTFRNVQELQSVTLSKDVDNLSLNFVDTVDLMEDSFKGLDLSNLEALKLDNCKIGTLSGNSFSKLANLITLELHSNEIVTIVTDAFYRLNNLKKLDLTLNDVTTLDDKAFNGLTLETFYLRNNMISNLTAQTFSGLKVSNVILKANKLSRLTSVTLEPIKDTITNITITENGIILDVDDNAFKDTDLQVLRISNYSIQLLNFLKHVKTVTLDLSHNDLIFTDFDRYPNLNSVRYADLSATGIKRLTSDKFSSLSGLNELNLSQNNIFILDGDSFGVMTQLTKLNLSSNPIFRISRDFGNYVQNLRELILSGCRLAEFMDPEPFQPMYNLRVLDLRDNLIQIVDPVMEPIINQLDNDGLRLTGNKFHCNCENLWFKQWATKQDTSTFTCVSPTPNIDIITMADEDFICVSPIITGIKGTADYGASASGSGAILEVPVNASIMLQCTGRGDPAPELQWDLPAEIHDEVVVEPGINRTTLDTTSYYGLKTIRLEQSGQFWCSAVNIVNSSDAYIEVIVRENMTIPVAIDVLPTTRKTSSLLAVVILVSIIVLLIIFVMITVIYKIVNREYNYHVAEAERLNELTAVNGAPGDKPETELLDVSSDQTNHNQTEL